MVFASGSELVVLLILGFLVLASSFFSDVDFVAFG